MIRTPSPPKPTWLDVLEARLVHPGASADARLKKMIVLAFLALAFFFFLAHAAFFAAGGAFRTAALDLFGAVVAAALAAVMPRVADPVPLWRVYTALHFVLMFLINHSLGGLQHAQGSLIYVLFFPLVVYAIDGVRAAVFALVAGMGVYGASVWAAPYAPADQLPPAWMLTTLGLSNMVGTTAVGLVAVYFYGRQSRFLATQLVEEKEARAQETQALLENMLPRDVAQELASTGSTKPVRHDAVSILFTDFSGFTQASAAMPADMVVSQLNEIFAAFDDICDECGVEKSRPSVMPTWLQRACRKVAATTHNVAYALRGRCCSSCKHATRPQLSSGAYALASTRVLSYLGWWASASTPSMSGEIPSTSRPAWRPVARRDG